MDRFPNSRPLRAPPLDYAEDPPMRLPRHKIKPPPTTRKIVVQAIAWMGSWLLFVGFVVVVWRFTFGWPL